MGYENNTYSDEDDILEYAREYQPYDHNKNNHQQRQKIHDYLQKLNNELFSRSISIQKHGRRHYNNNNQLHVYSNLQQTTQPQKINEEYDEDDMDDENDDITELLKLSDDDPQNNAAIALHVRNIMSELEIAAEEDVYLNLRSRPCVYKLKKLPLLTRVLSTKQLQLKFMDHGVLNLLNKWLQPLPDGTLADVKLRAGILHILTEFPIRLDHYGTRKQLNKSGLEKVITSLSESNEETDSNRKLATNLVNKWASMQWRMQGGNDSNDKLATDLVNKRASMKWRMQGTKGGANSNDL